VRGFCQDATRLGLPRPRHRRLTGDGVNPVQVGAPLYEYSGLSAAVEPTTGEACWWALPRRDADCFPVFLRQFGQHSAERLNIVLREQAPAHVAQRVEVPENIVLVWLPASSPEVHPVERLWEDLKYRIAVRNGPVRASLRAVQEHVAGLVQRSSAERIASLTGYAYLVEAAYTF
jgi:hypothetical protein